MEATKNLKLNSRTSQFTSLFEKIDEISNTKFSKVLTKIYGEYEKINQKNSEYEETIFANINTKMIEVRHSKIIATILRNKECRLEFFQVLNSLKTLKGNYEEATVTTEFSTKDGRIDIFIEDKKSKNVIIIENKITDAPDQNKQLKRYYSDRIEKGYTVDGVVYLVTDENKNPSEWEKFSAELKEKLIIFPIHSKNSNNTSTLLEFLKRCKHLTKNADNEILNSTIIQYEQLVKNLLKEKKMTDEQQQQIYSLLKDSGYSIEDLENFKEFGKSIGDFANEGSVKARLEHILSECGEKWILYMKGWCMYQDLQFKLNINERTRNIKLEIGIAIESDLQVYAYITYNGNYPLRLFIQFVKANFKHFLAKTKMKFNENDGYYSCWLPQLESNSSLKEADEKIIDYLKTTLIPSINELKKLPSFVK